MSGFLDLFGNLFRISGVLVVSAWNVCYYLLLSELFTTYFILQRSLLTCELPQEILFACFDINPRKVSVGKYCSMFMKPHPFKLYTRIKVYNGFPGKLVRMVCCVARQLCCVYITGLPLWVFYTRVVLRKLITRAVYQIIFTRIRPF